MIDFNKLIDKHLKREFRPKKVGRYYPSEIANCLRKVWYSYREPKETPAETVRIFQAGNIMHDFVVDVLKSEKTPEVELLWSEYPFKMDMDDYLVSGRVDNLILLRMSGKVILVEVKSTRSLKYLEKPQPHHLMQLQLYMHATGVHNGVLLYIERNSLSTRVFDVDFKHEVADEAIKRFSSLHLHLKEDKIPDPEARMKESRNWECSYCDYRTECYQETPKGEIPSGKKKD